MKINELLRCLAGLAMLLTVVQSAAEETAVVKEDRINVRGRPSLIGEVITQLQKGESVVVLEEITLSKPKTNEPPKWLRIQMPANTPVWVFAPFIDSSTKTVNVSRLNLRGGPGENYSVVGRLDRGTAVREIRRVEDWLEIETPPGAYAFIAANLVSQPGAGSSTMASRAVPERMPSTSPSAEPTSDQQPSSIRLPEPAAVQQQPSLSRQPPPVSQQPTAGAVRREQASAMPASPSGEWQPIRPQQPSTSAAPNRSEQTPSSSSSSAPVPGQWQPVTPQQPSSGAVPTTTTAAENAPSAPLPQESRDRQEMTAVRPAAVPTSPDDSQRRVVRREGLVRSTVSIQAPTYYELLSPANRKTINYLHTEKLGLSLKDYRGRRIIVTGEEAIDPRWPRTPVIDVETLELVP